MEIEGRKFNLVSAVNPKRDPDGSIWTHEPQARYAKAATSKLHAYGDGAFCKYRFDDAPVGSGVYVIVQHRKVVNVGQADNLKRRLNQELGHITPSSCFEHGQPTNCRINKKILELLQSGEEVEVWFCPCVDQLELKNKVQASLAPPWNRRGTDSLPRCDRQEDRRFRPGFRDIDRLGACAAEGARVQTWRRFRREVAIGHRR